MVKFCPHDLFVNTRADLGVCSKVHDDEVKTLFDKSTSYKKQAYEDEFIRFSQGMLNEVERKIVKGKQRLALIGNKPEPVSKHVIISLFGQSVFLKPFCAYTNMSFNFMVYTLRLVDIVDLLAKYNKSIRVGLHYLLRISLH